MPGGVRFAKREICRPLRVCNWLDAKLPVPDAGLMALLKGHNFDVPEVQVIFPSGVFGQDDSKSYTPTMSPKMGIRLLNHSFLGA